MSIKDKTVKIEGRINTPRNMPTVHLLDGYKMIVIGGWK
jgi:hypothetical protein